MAKVNFYLNNKADSKGNCGILLYFCHRALRIPVSINETIPTKVWNKKSQRVRLSYSEGKSINDRLDDLELNVKEMFRKKFSDVIPRKIYVKEEIQKIISPDLFTPATNDLIEFATSYASNTPKKLPTKKNYFQTINVLKKFKENNRVFRANSILFNDVNLDFYDEFYNFLEKEIGLAKNTIGTHIKNIKVFMKQALDRNLHNNHSFRLSGFTVVSEETDSTFLDPRELKDIYDLDLSMIRKYEKIRDLFIVGCWTGLRHSDWHQVRVGNIYNEDYLKIKTIKGDRTVIIPLHNYVRQILEKYNYELPPVISNQKTNDYLKVIGRLSGVSGKVSQSMTKAGKRQFETFFKWEKISTHTARRSFATNMYNMNVPTLTIMAITGHKTEKSFLRYIKVSQEQHAAKLLKIWKDQEPSLLKAV